MGASLAGSSRTMWDQDRPMTRQRAHATPGQGRADHGAGERHRPGHAEIIGREGGTVVAVDFDRGGVDEVVSAIRAAGGPAHGLPADALDAGAVRGRACRPMDARGRIDILVNAVGGSTIIVRPAAGWTSSASTTGSACSTST